MKQENTVTVGIDWADAKHDFHLIAPDGQIHCGVFKSNPEAIAAQIEHWRMLAPGCTFNLAIEATKGAIINALLEYDDVQIHPVNPNALANYRKAFAHGGGKNDPTDAMLLAQLISHHRDRFEPLQRDSELTRKIAALAEDRRRLVDSRADLANELTALLKAYFPVALALKPARPYSQFFLKFLLKYPSLSEAQAAGKTRLRNFFHGIGRKSKAADHAATLCDAVPLTRDNATIESLAMRVTAVAEQLQTLSKHIKRYEATLKQLLPEHDRFAVASSFPNASTNTQARLIAAMGDDRNRYPKVENLQAASAIAPITTQSGKQKHVSSRWACSKFLRQTFHEYAGLSITASRWAKAYYEQQKSDGKSAQTAKRALAYKWQRIIYRCWQSGQPYDEARYIERLKTTGSPLYRLIEAAG